MVVSDHRVRYSEGRLLKSPSDTSWDRLSIFNSLRLHGDASFHRTHLPLEESTESRVVSSVHEVKLVGFCFVHPAASVQAMISLCSVELKGLIFNVTSCGFIIDGVVLITDVIKWLP